eukprot:scaffold11041_cov69-Phaeocystis_antarctica.AAC.2
MGQCTTGWCVGKLACDVRVRATRPPVRDRNAWLLTPELFAAVRAAHARTLRGVAFAWGHLSRRSCVKVAVLQEDVQTVPLHTGPPHQFRELARLHAGGKVREVRPHSFTNRSDGAWRHLVRVTLRWPRGAEVGIAHFGAVARMHACRRRRRHWCGLRSLGAQALHDSQLVPRCKFSKYERNHPRNANPNQPCRTNIHRV